MWSSLNHLDRLLRGEATRADELRQGQLGIHAGSMAIMIVILGMIYGLCMGSYSVLKEVPDSLERADQPYMQLIATTVKVPALFYLTLLVTFPSLYVFNALVGSRLTLTSVMRLLVASVAVNLAVLASLGPIVLFFSVSTKSYAFIKLLNVLMFTVAGVFGLSFLLQTLHRLTSGYGSQNALDVKSDNAAAPTDRPSDDLSALDMPPGQVLGHHTRLVFGCWVVVFALVGAQMGWVLRPFVGNPEQPFEWFRPRQSNFFEGVINAIGALFDEEDEA